MTQCSQCSEVPSAAVLWQVRLHRFAQCMKCVAELADTRLITVTLTVTDAKYYVRFEEILVSVRRLTRMAVGVVALDAETARFFTSRGVPTIRLQPRREGAGAIREAVLRAKSEVASAILELGLRVVFSEMDVFWRENPLVLLDELPGDFLVSENAHDSEMNIGFWIAKPTLAVLQGLHRVTAYLRGRDRWPGDFAACEVFDQALFDHALRGPRSSGRLITQCGMPQQYLDRLYNEQSSAIPYRFIPYSRLPHYWNRQTFNETVVARAVGAHIFSLAGSPNVQVQIAKQLGLWRPDVPLELALEGSSKIVF